MRTEIKCRTRLEALNVIRILEKYGINYIKTEAGFVADIEPAKAWAIGLI